MTFEKRSSGRKHVILAAAAAIACLCLIGVFASPVHAIKAPAKVTGVKIKSYDTSATVTWKAAKRANSYEVQYKKSSAKKWSGGVITTDTYAEIDGLKASTKYKVRVRGANEKMGKWSSAKTFTTKFQRPKAIWPSYISSTRINIMWPEVAGAKEYRVTWYQDNPDEYGKDPVKKVKGNSCEFADLQEAGGYTFIVRAVSKKGKVSPGTSIFLGTFENSEDVMELKNYPVSPYVELTRFDSGHDAMPGRERDIPPLYRTDYDSEGNVTADGYYFVDAKIQQSVTLYYGTIRQANPSDIAHPFEKTISSKTTFKVGDSITMPNGETATITGLTIQSLPNEVFDGCERPEDAYGKVTELNLQITTDKGSAIHPDPYVKWTPWKSH